MAMVRSSSPIGLSGSTGSDQSSRSAASHCCFLPLAYSLRRSAPPSSYSQVNEVVVWPSNFHWVCSTGSLYRNWVDMDPPAVDVALAPAWRGTFRNRAYHLD